MKPGDRVKWGKSYLAKLKKHNLLTHNEDTNRGTITSVLGNQVWVQWDIPCDNIGSVHQSNLEIIRKRFLVLVILEGHIQPQPVWLCQKDNRWLSTEDFKEATRFQSLQDAHAAIGEYIKFHEMYMIGYQTVLTT